jgi:hypothetical protein
MAVSIVDIGGENRAAWLNATKSPGLLELDWWVTAKAVVTSANCVSVSFACGVIV